VKLEDPNAYYSDRAVEHTAQGDIYAGIPLVQATRTDPSFEAAGARKRPGGPDPHASHIIHVGLAVVLHYTCGITAQSPGTAGYSHEHRLMAPVVALRELRRWRMGNNELRKIRDGRTIQGFMYLPQIGGIQLDAPGTPRTSGRVTLRRSSTARRASRRRSSTTSRESHVSPPTQRAS
jgi:hypothetical protein